MKQRELNEKCQCSICGKKPGEAKLPMFFTLNIKQWGLDINAIRRQAGLEMQLGHPAIAQVMGPDEDMAKKVDEAEITVCFDCAMDEQHSIPVLMSLLKEENDEHTR